MLNFKSVELEDKKLLEPYLRSSQYNNCDFSFTNVYMWRKKYRTSWALCGGRLVLLSGEKVFLMPLGSGPLEPVLREMMDYARDKSHPFVIGAVTPQMWEELQACMPGAFEYTTDRDYCDYLYAGEKLANLAGKKLHSKRNHINKFKATYPDYSYETITADNLPEVVEMHSQWCVINHCVQDPELLEESCAVRDVLRHYEALEVQGGLLRAGGRVVAFSIGQPINDQCYDVCIEKAFYDVNGAYTMINQQFVQHNCQGFAWINREEDLGLEGLRKAKTSYYPEILLDKGTVCLQEE
ncbi:MAG: DUF2156 domain-containing protein [Eubacteriales bacterium]|jgi:hypothetical protein